MNESDFFKYFDIDKKNKALVLKRDIIIESINAYDVYTYIQDNYNFCAGVLRIGKCVQDISNFQMKDLFWEIQVEEGNKHFATINKDLYSKDLTQFIHCCVGNKNSSTFTIQKGVKVIKNGCFNFDFDSYPEDEIVLKKIVLNAELEEIEDFAFCGGAVGQKIIINDNLSILHYNSFDCYGLDFQISNNPHFKIENGILIYLPLKLVLKTEPEAIIRNLETILSKNCKILHSAILSAINKALSDLANHLNTNIAVEIEQFLKKTKGIVADKETFLAFYPYYSNKDILEIPEGITTVSAKLVLNKIKKIIFPKSLKVVETRRFNNNGIIVEKPSLSFLGVSEFEVANGNTNFYTDTKILYDLSLHKVVAVAGKNLNFSQIYINNPLISQFEDGFYPSFISVDEVIFCNDFNIEIKGKLAPNADIKRIVFKSTKIKYSDKLFNNIRNLQEILVDDLDFAKEMFENISEAHKNKIYCSDKSFAKDTSINYRGVNYYPIKCKKITTKTQSYYEKILQHIKTTPNFSKYSIAKLLNITPSTALSYMDRMEKLKLIKRERFATANTISMIIDNLQREKQILEVLKNGNISKTELLKQMNVDDNMIKYFEGAILRLRDLGVIHFNVNNNIISLAINVEEYYERIDYCKNQILGIFKIHKAIKVKRTLYVKGFNQAEVKHSLEELIVEGKIFKIYGKENRDLDDHLTNYYYCPFSIIDYDSSEDMQNYNFVRQKSFYEKELEYNVYLQKEIMKILSSSRIAIEEIEAKIIKNDEFNFSIFSAIMELEEQGAIKYQVENHMGKPQSFISAKKSYAKWFNEVENIQKKILDTLSKADFSSREYLLQLSQNKNLFWYVMRDLESQQKIVESRKIDEKTGRNLQGYKLLKN